MAIRRYLSPLLAAFLAAGPLPAAEHQGSVKFGGVPVPGATVTATQGEKRVSTLTNPQGGYAFPDLADGAWKVKVEMLLFAPAEKEVTVAPAAAPEVWELKLAPTADLIAAAPKPAPSAPSAPATPGAAQTAQAAPEKKSNSKKGQPAAANSSSAFQRAQLSASAQAPKQDDATLPSSVTEAQSSDGLLISGSVNNGASSPFAQSAAFGNFRYKQKLYSATVTLGYDNAALNARPYSLNGQQTDRPDYYHGTGSISAQGPLKIPALFGRTAPNVTVEYEWVRNRNASISTGLVPTDLERQGDFTRSTNAAGGAVTALDPTNQLPFAGNQIPTNRISPQAALLLSLYPRANFTADSRRNYQLPLIGSTHSDSFRVRGSRSLWGKNYLNSMFSYQNARGDSTGMMGFLNTTGQSGFNTSLTLSRRFSMRANGTLTFQMTRGQQTTLPFYANRYNISGMAGVTGNNQEPRNWGPPALNFSSGFAGLSDTQYQLGRNQNVNLGGTFTYSHGSHNYSFAGDLKRQSQSPVAQQDARGSFTFTGAAAGSDFAGFLLGVPDGSSIAFGNADKYFRGATYSAAAADDWRAGASITLNAGLRWEYNTPVTEKYGRLVNLDVTPGFAGAAPVLASAPVGPLTGNHYSDALMRAQRGAVQPRVGLSWRPFPASSLVVRAGYGVYYDGGIYTTIVNRLSQQSPLSKSLSVSNSADTPITLANGFSLAPNRLSTTYAVDPNFRPGYAQNWQLTLQRDLPFSLVAVASYLGIKGTHAQQQFLPNTYPAGVTPACALCPSGFTYLVSNGNSTKHQAQLQLRRRLHSGFTAQMEYVYAKAIDNAMLGGQGAPVVAQDWTNLRGERGRSSFDRRHQVTAGAQYTTGMGLAGGTLVGGWKGAIFKDWTIVATFTAGSGLPLSPSYPALVGSTGVYNTVRPDYTGASLYDAPAGFHLNRAAVSAPGALRWGNAGRNSINGPSQFTTNASLSRAFRISETKSAELKVESTNPINHVSYSSWNVSALSSQFGLPVGAGSMRTLRTNLRVRF